MNPYKFCFIMCSNNPQYEHECIKYINNLTIPEGYEIEIKVIRDAASITSGYNRGMLSSDAKYKIYLHQDTFIINKDFLNCLLKGFNDEATGMIGIIGTPQLDSSCVMWLGNRVGKLVSNCIYHTVKATIGEITSPTEVEAIDGLLMATQYDIPWREDIFKGWDYYDISQSFEFRKAGHKVMVLPAAEPWCFHDDGILELSEYYKTRDIFMQEYSDMLSC
jgi:hypothetical protein